MKFQIATKLLLVLPMASGFMASNNRPLKPLRVTATGTAEDAKATAKPIYDPLGLYPESSTERQQGQIQPMEPVLQTNRKIKDPLGLYPKDSPEFGKQMKEEQARIEAQKDKPIFDPMNLYAPNTPERQQGIIETMEPPIDIQKDTRDPMGIYPKNTDEFMESLELERESLENLNRELYDPLGLYPEDSPERQQGKIKVLEPKLEVVKPVVDPMGLYPPEQVDEVDTDAVMSEALPFAHRPSYLDGSLSGDAGFDPLGLARSVKGLQWQREAELKHARIAMLAAAGWPLAELFHKNIASLLHLKPLLVDGDRVPSLLNGGLQQINPFYWMGVLAIAGLFEGISVMKQNGVDRMFDPLKLFPSNQEGQRRMEDAELRNGRLAMLAITAFVAFEAFTQQAVVNGTPFLFHPLF